SYHRGTERPAGVGEERRCASEADWPSAHDEDKETEMGIRNSRSAVRALVRVVGIVAALLPCIACAAQRPNIVYILADDLGWKDLGFHGGDIATPNLDRLAESGAMLNAFYVQPLSSQTRAALLTGRYPMRYGLQTHSI